VEPRNVLLAVDGRRALRPSTSTPSRAAPRDGRAPRWSCGWPGDVTLTGGLRMPLYWRGAKYSARPVEAHRGSAFGI